MIDGLPKNGKAFRERFYKHIYQRDQYQNHHEQTRCTDEQSARPQWIAMDHPAKFRGQQFCWSFRCYESTHYAACRKADALPC